jgi:hypothetical protein
MKEFDLEPKWFQKNGKTISMYRPYDVLEAIWASGRFLGIPKCRKQKPFAKLMIWVRKCVKADVLSVAGATNVL